LNTNANGTQLRDFVAAKFGQAEGYLCVWVKRGNTTEAFPVNRLEDVTGFIERASKKDDVYIAIGTQVEPPTRRRRGSADTVSSLTGLFGDIDLADAKGAQSGYPKNEDEALEILSSFPVRPTSIVHTGNGVHAHFDFDKPWLLRTPADRAAAADLSAGFQRVFLAHFRAHGCKIDSVGDIARNFRPPGTLNHKSEPPKTVRLIEFDPTRRHSIEAIRKLVGTRTTRRKGDRRPAAPSADHAKIVEGCAWYRTVVVEGAPTCPEPDWFAGASIAAMCKGGEDAFLEYSGKHPEFKEREARDKFRRAVKSNAPRTCASIADDLGHRDTCEACPHWGQITSPIQLGHSACDPGARGPLPLGDTAEDGFALLDSASSEFLVTERGLFYQKVKGKSVVSVFVSGPFEILGLARDDKSSGWSRYLRWKDADGGEHKYLAPDKMLLSDHDAVCGDLAHNGLKIGKGQQAAHEIYSQRRHDSSSDAALSYGLAHDRRDESVRLAERDHRRPWRPYHLRRR